MFTLGSFSAFFWTLATIILLMIVFEDKLLAIEEKHDKKKAEKRRAKKAPEMKSRKTVTQVKRMPEAKRNTNTDRRVNRNFAA